MDAAQRRMSEKTRHCGGDKGGMSGWCGVECRFIGEGKGRSGVGSKDGGGGGGRGRGFMCVCRSHNYFAMLFLGGGLEHKR